MGGDEKTVGLLSESSFKDFAFSVWVDCVSAWWGFFCWCLIWESNGRRTYKPNQKLSRAKKQEADSQERGRRSFVAYLALVVPYEHQSILLLLQNVAAVLPPFSLQWYCRIWKRGGKKEKLQSSHPSIWDFEEEKKTSNCHKKRHHLAFNLLQLLLYLKI